jgi:hypothetical protein
MNGLDHARSDFRHMLTRVWVCIIGGMIAPKPIVTIVCFSLSILLLTSGIYMRTHIDELYEEGN